MRSSAVMERDRLMAVVRRVRRRWRLRLVLTGLAILAGGSLLVVAGSAALIETFRFDPGVVRVLKLVAWVAVGLLAGRFLLRPLRRRVSDAQVALYLEEREPTLGGLVVSAVDCGAHQASPASPVLVERLVERALERSAEIDFGWRVERMALRRSSGTLAGIAALGAVLLLGGPPWLGRGALVLAPWRGAEEANPYRIDVLPRDTVVARGSDLRVEARLTGFEAGEVDLVTRRGAQGEWSRWPMTAADSTGSVSAFLLDLDQPTEFFVEAGGVRSPVVRVNVVDLPYVRSIALEYRFPVYTGLTPQRVEGTGDVAAVVGTVVRVEVTPTIPPRGGVLVVDGRDTVVLQPRDSGLAGEIRVSRSGSYRVLFDAVGGGRVAGSPEYLIDALVDQPPLVRFSEPGRDLVVTSVEEVAARLTAEDDYGVAALELRFSVNGGEERRVSLLANGRRKEAAAGHTFYLEEFRLEPGDFVSYHGRATEAGRAGAAQEAVTDMYFLEVRPFDRVYRQADQAPGGGGGGGGGMAGELSERQRQVVAGTFNLVRDRARYDDAEQRKHLTTLALSQGRLREEVSTLKSRIEERGIAQLDSTFRGITEALGGAIQEMEGAEELLGERKAEEALGPEQRALKHLQRAEATFREVQVARGQQGGGGGGRGEGPNAEELADLFDLEMDRLGNQYERLERGAREEADQQLDELMEKLRELSRRQQQENERARARAEQMASGAGGTGEAQRRLAQETEDMARRLERLAREQSRPELNESARRLREAAESMRRAAAQGTDGSAQGRSALDELRDARRLLERDRSVGLRGQVDDALRRATRLAEQQREMESAVGELGGAAPDPARVRRLQERKTEMATELEGLERDLDRLAQQSRRDQREASGKLADAARFIRDAKIREKMLYSRGIIQGRSPDYARNFEQQIGDELDQVRQQVADAAGSVGETREQRVARALDQTRDLVRSLESVSDRMGEQGQPGQRDQEARPGQQGDRGREGQQGQGGQQGQEGQPGQGQRGADGGRDLGGPGGWGQGRYDPRQWSRDLRQGIADARELRRLLSAEGVDVRDLDGYIGRLRELDGRSSWGDPEAQRTLELEVIQGLKEFEFALRRQIEGGDQQRLFLSGSDEVPEGYRRLVERYYRALSEGRAR